MTGVQSLEARTALGAVCAVVSYFTASSAWIHRAGRKSFDRAVNIAFVISRLGLYFFTFFVLNIEVRGDIPTFYVLPARAAFLHRMPYRDYPTSYAPVHPFFDALILLIWNSPLAIVLFSILAECFLLPVWMRVARIFASERAVRMAAVLYLTSAASVQFVAIDGQDNVVIAVLMGLALLALARYRAVLSGFLIAIGAVIFKFLPILFVPAFLVMPARRLRWLLGFVGTLVVGYGYFAYIRLPLLFPVTFEHSVRTASDLPFIVEAIVGYTPPPVVEDVLLGIVLLAVLALLAAIAVRRPSLVTTIRTATFGSTALLLAVLIFARRSWPPYMMLMLFPLCLGISRRSHLRLCLAGFAVFNLFAVVTHSFWATVLISALAGPFHQGLLRHDPATILSLALQIGLIAGYLWLLSECISELRLARIAAANRTESITDLATSSRAGASSLTSPAPGSRS